MGKFGETVVPDPRQLAGVDGSSEGGGCLLLKTSLDFVIKGLSLPFYSLTSNRSVYTL